MKASQRDSVVFQEGREFGRLANSIGVFLLVGGKWSRGRNRTHTGRRDDTEKSTTTGPRTHLLHCHVMATS